VKSIRGSLFTVIPIADVTSGLTRLPGQATLAIVAAQSAAEKAE
jgi:hypothetical protein